MEALFFYDSIHFIDSVVQFFARFIDFVRTRVGTIEGFDCTMKKILEYTNCTGLVTKNSFQRRRRDILLIDCDKMIDHVQRVCNCNSAVKAFGPESPLRV